MLVSEITRSALLACDEDENGFFSAEKDQVVTMVKDAWLNDLKTGFAKADLIEHGSLKTLFEKIAMGCDPSFLKQRKGLVPQCGGTTSLVRAARVLDEGELMSLALLWNPCYTPVVVCDKRQTLEHVTVDDVVDYLHKAGASRCAAAWIRVHKLRPLETPTDYSRHYRIVDTRLDPDVIPNVSNVPEWVKRDVVRSSLVLDCGPACLRPEAWKGSLFTTVLICEYETCADGCFSPSSVLKMADMMRDGFGLLLIEVYACRYAFYDSGVDERLFRLHASTVGRRLGMKLRFAVKVLDPGTSLVLWGRADPVVLEDIEESPWIKRRTDEEFC